MHKSAPDGKVWRCGLRQLKAAIGSDAIRSGGVGGGDAGIMSRPAFAHLTKDTLIGHEALARRINLGDPCINLGHVVVA